MPELVLGTEDVVLFVSMVSRVQALRTAVGGVVSEVWSSTST